MEPQVLLNDYNYYRTYTWRVQELRAKGGYVQDLKMKLKKGEDRTPFFEEMLDFCQDHNLDPKLWLYMLFKIRGWKVAPFLSQLVPRTKKTLQKNLGLYATLVDVPLFQERREQQRDQAFVGSELVWDKNRDIGWSTEALKRRYLNEGDSARCLRELEERTFGYHPKSLVCARCPMARQCMQLLESKFGGHIIALRRGEITVQQAQQLSNNQHVR